MRIETNFYTLTPYDNLLYIETFSSWDERIVAEYIADIERLALRLYANKPWAMLVDRKNWELLTPNAENMIRDRARGKFQTNLMHTATVVGESALKDWQIENITRDNKQFKSRRFQNLEDAKAWIESCGYTMTPLKVDVL